MSEHEDALPVDFSEINWSENIQLADAAYEERQAVENVPLTSTVEKVKRDREAMAALEKEFKLFCHRQVSSNARGWSTDKCLPWRTDAKLESLVLDLNISKSKAAKWWRDLKRSHKKKKTIIDASLVAAKKRFEKVIVLRPHLEGDVSYAFGNDNTEKLKEILEARVREYNSILAKTIVGTNVQNKKKKTSTFQKAIRDSLAVTAVSVDQNFQKAICDSLKDMEVSVVQLEKTYLSSCRRAFPRIRNDVTFRHIFISLEHDLFKVWNATINLYMTPSIDVDVDETRMEDIIVNAGGILYFITGWLLQQLNHLRGAKAEFALKFVQRNRQGVCSDGLKTLPTGVVDSCEKHHGKLTRVSSQFFHFVQLVECVYVTNLSNGDNRWSYKDKLFQEIYKATLSATQIKAAFHACTPEGVSPQEEKVLIEIVLQKYMFMRCKDYLRVLKNKEVEALGTQDNLAFRGAETWLE